MRKLIVFFAMLAVVALLATFVRSGTNEAYSGNRNVAYGVDAVVAVKTVIKTINLDSSDDNDDFEFDDSQANVTEQAVDLGTLIPAYAEILSAQVRCFETVAGSGDTTVGLELGTSGGEDQILATANTDTANDINATAATAGPEVVATNAARHIWITGTPTANWSTLTAGRWAVMVTYIDYGAVYTAEGP